jgi:hypothetical protein
VNHAGLLALDRFPLLPRSTPYGWSFSRGPISAACGQRLMFRGDDMPDLRTAPGITHHPRGGEAQQ